jgi:alpha-tubulin suppressor-like RCC1 family protein
MISFVLTQNASAFITDFIYSLFSWGKQNSSNCLGRPDVPPGTRSCPAKIDFFHPSTPVASCDCESGYSAAITRDGSLYTWGSNAFGRLGVGDFIDRTTPTIVSLGEGARVVALSLGTL